MKRIVAFALICVGTFFVGGCDISDNDQNFHFVTLQIVSAEVPETFEHNGVYQIPVTYVSPNQCTFFQGFDVQNDDLTTRSIVAIGSELIDSDDACTQVAEEVEAEFTFRVLYTDPYTFRFYAGDDENGDPIFLEYMVEVTTETTDQ